ncbi:hypothetical protein PP182_11005 [Maribacter sp. PR1]|uniref:Uncharacterized protein n=1 Tax=Maribacter cobaltidurans TaxID=1178778 RepID=A0ABU7IUG2_9FLAO|nr:MULTISPECIES: hypothetical protein [Maribacter]MDC6389211.1 hypothetical protein [Maribacter sp. PR1]MEE1976598.1 hypothetical protein [Maribacter cobaltidurans]
MHSKAVQYFRGDDIKNHAHFNQASEVKQHFLENYQLDTSPPCKFDKKLGIPINGLTYWRPELSNPLEGASIRPGAIELQQVGCALSGFCFTLIYRNTTKTRQDPCAKVGVRFGGLIVLLLNSSVLREAYKETKLSVLLNR